MCKDGLGWEQEHFALCTQLMGEVAWISKEHLEKECVI